jgi:hypothetical protein
MPIKINWTNGKYLGMSLLYFGIMGLTQALIFIPIGQYVINVGSLYVVIMLPVGITLAMTYSTQILYESYLQVRTRNVKKYRNIQTKIRFGLESEMIKSMLVIIISFAIIFGITYAITNNLAPINSFVVSENVSAIGTLVIASILESQFNTELKT